MSIKRLKPNTPGQRFSVLIKHDGEGIQRENNPEKRLLKPYKKTGGRNKEGKMTIKYVGGGHKKRFRLLDTKRDKLDIPGKVKRIEYDPNRTAYIALVVYPDGDKRYILAPNGLKPGKEVVSSEKASPEVGNTLPLHKIPLGSIVHNIELRPGQGGNFARSAGSYAQLLAKEGKYATLKMPSGETRMVLSKCKATIGTVSNVAHSLTIKGKAGRARWHGRRPRTRPTVMNPVDHPMGGGEGKSSGGLPRNKRGLYAIGQKTRKRKKSSSNLIIERRKKK